MKSVTHVAIFVLGILVGLFVPGYLSEPKNVIEQKANEVIKPLEKYYIENLSKTDIKVGKLTIKDSLSENEEFDSYLFEFEFSPNFDNKTYKKTTGMINFPDNESFETPLGIITMIRGFVPQELYSTGMGSKNAANYFAENGYITIAPDFLGYGDSDEEAGDIFESRFQTYTTVISLQNTLESLTTNPEIVSGPQDIISSLTTKNYPLFMWAHSNGGQIALTTLEVTLKNYPTVLWAPVTKPFPYSILYYTDEADDEGKFLRSKLADFEQIYDVDKYSLTNYLDRIVAPIHLDHGTDDESVPLVWSDVLITKLEELEIDITYETYLDADHNMRPLWDKVVENDLIFFNSYLPDTFDRK